jgi:hypothetical protein
LNRFDTNLFDAFVTRWLVWIRFFDFEIRHVSDIKHIAADDLFKKSLSSNDLKKIVKKKNIDDWIDAQLNCVRVFFVSIVEKEFSFILISEYSEKSQKIVVYLFTLRKSSEMTLKEFNKFKKKVLRFKLQKNQFFRRNSKNVFMKRVIDDFEKRQRILKQLHDENDHRDKKKTYKRIINRYWWNNLYDDSQKYVKTCSQCQLKDFIKEKKTFHSIWMTFLWKKNKREHCSYVVKQRKTLFDCRSWWLFWMNKNTRFIWSKSLTNDQISLKKRHL